MISVLLKLRKHQVLIRIGNHHPPQSDSSLSHGSTGIHALDHELLGSVGPIFGRLHFYFKDSNSVKMSFFFGEKKHRLTKKTTFAAGYSIPFSMSPLGEKKNIRKKRNIRHHMGLLQIWGYSGVSLGG